MLNCKYIPCLGRMFDVKSREVSVRKRLENKGFPGWSRFWIQDNTPGKCGFNCQRKHIYMKKWRRV